MPPQMRTRAERMRDRDARFFTGRHEQIEYFKTALRAVQDEARQENNYAKTTIAISGEGGMGKTTLLGEFSRICELQEPKVECIYLDMRRREEPSTTSVIEFIRVWRSHFSQSKPRILLGKEYFADFDKSYTKFLELDKQLKEFEAKQKESLSVTDIASNLGSKALVSISK